MARKPVDLDPVVRRTTPDTATQDEAPTLPADGALVTKSITIRESEWNMLAYRAQQFGVRPNNLARWALREALLQLAEGKVAQPDVEYGKVVLRGL